jgi:hypothetical protein
VSPNPTLGYASEPVTEHGFQQTLLKLAREARQRGRHELAALAAEDGLRSPSYQTEFLEELSINGYYSALPGHRSKAADACEELLRSRQTPAHQRWLARSNSQYHALVLNQAEIGQAIPIEFPPPEGYHLMNTSLAWQQDELWAIVRSVNYDYDNGAYLTPEGQGVHTINHLVQLDRDGNVSQRVTLEESPGGNPEASIRGVEDLRLFSWRERFFATGTVLDRNPEERCQIALLEFDRNGRSLSFHLLDEPQPLVHQKNWMPWSHGQHVGLLVNSEPTRWAELDPETGTIRWHNAHTSDLALHDLRGGSGWTEYQHKGQSGWLAVVHDVQPAPGGGRIYLHRLLWMNAQGRLEELSRPFRFFDVPVEYCSGLARDFDSDSFLLSLSRLDSAAYLYRLEHSELEALFEPIGATRG